MTKRSNPNAGFEEFDEFLHNVLRLVVERLNDHVTASQRLIDMKTLIAEPIRNPVEFEYRGQQASFQVLIDEKRVVVRSGEDVQVFSYSAAASEDVANAVVKFLSA